MILENKSAFQSVIRIWRIKVKSDLNSSLTWNNNQTSNQKRTQLNRAKGTQTFFQMKRYPSDNFIMTFVWFR